MNGFKAGDRVITTSFAGYYGPIMGFIKGINSNPLSESPIEINVIWNDDRFGDFTSDKAKHKTVLVHSDEIKHYR
jgi:hypothetical protein